MIRLVSWNVNGFRAILGKGFDDIFQSMDADVFCLQEVKLSAGQVDKEYDGYQALWHYAEKKGYSGTAVFTRVAPLSVRRGFSDDADVVDNEGRVLTVEFQDFFLVNVYVPNSQSELARLPYRMRWDAALRKHLMQLDAVKPVVMCGDLNVAHNEIDLRNPKTNHQNPGFTDDERDSFSTLLQAGFADTFRVLHPEAQRYSWWSYRYGARAKNIGWRIDYFVVSQRLMSNVSVAEIHEDIIGSDHCPVSLSLDI